VILIVTIAMLKAAEVVDRNASAVIIVRVQETF
jgi:hypothetical protein